MRAAARDPIKQHRVLSFGQLDGPEYLHGDSFYHLIVEPTERGERADMEDAARQLAREARSKRAAQAQSGGAERTPAGGAADDVIALDGAGDGDGGGGGGGGGGDGGGGGGGGGGGSTKRKRRAAGGQKPVAQGGGDGGGAGGVVPSLPLKGEVPKACLFGTKGYGEEHPSKLRVSNIAPKAVRAIMRNSALVSHDGGFVHNCYYCMLRLLCPIVRSDPSLKGKNSSTGLHAPLSANHQRTADAIRVADTIYKPMLTASANKTDVATAQKAFDVALTALYK